MEKPWAGELQVSRLRTWASSFWVKLGLSAGLLALLVCQTNLLELGRAVAAAGRGWLLVALVTYTASQALSAVRWALLARPLGFAEPLSRFCTYYFSGMFLNLFAPGTVAGDIGRGLFLAGGQRRTAALATVLAHRGIGFVALVWVGAAAILLRPDFPLPRAIRWAAWLIPPGTVIAWLWGPLIAVRLLAPGNRWRKFVERDLDPYWKDHRLIALSFTLAALVHIAQIWSQVFIARALALSSQWALFFVFVPIINVAGMVPLSFSGIGVREAGYWYFLSLLGIEREAAIALGLLSSAVVLAAGLCVGPAFFFLPRRSNQVAAMRSQPRATRRSRKEDRQS